MKPSTAVSLGHAEPRLLCPICGCSEIVFHSDAELPVGSKLEKVAIFLCPESHTFFVPRCSLQQASSSSTRYSSFDSPSRQWKSRQRPTGGDSPVALSELKLLTAQARALRLEAARMRMQLEFEQRRRHLLLTSCLDRFKAIEEFNRQEDPRPFADGKRPFGLPIQ